MKKKYIKLVVLQLLTFFFSLSTVFAQVPQAINFQAIARDSSGNALVNTNIQIRLSVIDSAQAGSTAYQELRALQTNAHGSFSFHIGVNPAFITVGTFQNIDWNTGNKYLKIDYDPTNTFTFNLTLGVIKFASVSFAFTAKEVVYIDASGAQNGDALIFDSSTGKFEPGSQSYTAGPGILFTGNTISNTGDLSNNNEFQALSISNDTINLTNGGFVKLPYAFPYGFFPPIATVKPVTNVQSFSATINGLVNGKGLSTSVVFEWGLTTSYGNTDTASQSPVTGTYNVAVSANITVQSATNYHYRIRATNAVNTTYSSDMTFTTPLSAPVLTTIAISSITGISAASGGNITYNGGASVTARGVCWNTNTNPTLSNSFTSNGAGSGAFTSNMTGLTSVTTYYVRAYATNSVGTAYGNEVIFSTLPVVPTITTAVISGITFTSAASGGNITNDGGASISDRGVCWSTSLNPTIANIVTSDSTGTGAFTSSISGLETGTSYHVRAYATNSAGTAYGNDLSFLTTIVAIADSYQGGKVAYILQSGDPGYVAGQTHGIIIAPSDQGTAIWGCSGTDLPGADGTAIGTGAQNTIDILAACPTASIAARLCADLILDEYSDWHLPSINELGKLYDYWISFGGFGTYYWSSSESDINFALGFYFSGNYSVNFTKTNVLNVRAVRLF